MTQRGPRINLRPQDTPDDTHTYLSLTVKKNPLLPLLEDETWNLIIRKLNLFHETELTRDFKEKSSSQLNTLESNTDLSKQTLQKIMHLP